MWQTQTTIKTQLNKMTQLIAYYPHIVLPIIIGIIIFLANAITSNNNNKR